MNQAFDQYRELYYDGGVCSVYLWETGKENTSSFAGSILFKKAGDGSQKIKGCWDSIHIFEVRSSGCSEICKKWGVSVSQGHLRFHLGPTLRTSDCIQTDYYSNVMVANKYRGLWHVEFRRITHKTI